LESILFVSGTPIRFENLIEILPEFGQEAIEKESNRFTSDCEGASSGVELLRLRGYLFEPSLMRMVNGV